MLKGYAINQTRLEYLEKTVKLIDIANRIDERLEGKMIKEEKIIHIGKARSNKYIKNNKSQD